MKMKNVFFFLKAFFYFFFLFYSFFFYFFPYFHNFGNVKKFIFFCFPFKKRNWRKKWIKKDIKIILFLFYYLKKRILYVFLKKVRKKEKVFGAFLFFTKIKTYKPFFPKLT